MSLAVNRLPASSNQNMALELVLIHGWGSSSVIWENWLSQLRTQFNVTLIDLPGYGINAHATLIDLDTLVSQILEASPPQAIYCGYSLGGMLSLTIAQQFPQRVIAAITLASNLKFVATAAWPQAMDANTFDAFYQLVATRTSQSLKRFAGLQAAGAENEKALIKYFRERVETIAVEVLTWSLALLKDIDHSDQTNQLAVPLLCLLGENDQLVPAVVADSLRKNIMAEVVVFKQAPHCFMLSHVDQCWSALQAFLSKHDLLAEKLPRAGH